MGPCKGTMNVRNNKKKITEKKERKREDEQSVSSVSCITYNLSRDMLVARIDSMKLISEGMLPGP